MNQGQDKVSDRHDIDADSGEHVMSTCLNCGHQLHGKYCHHCGQSAHLHRSIGAIAHEILHGVAHFEGKFWRTLPLLILRPGQLTRRYVEGERTRFISPMALFLFSIFLTFAVLSFAGIAPPIELKNGAGGTVSATLRTEALSERETIVARLKSDTLPQSERKALERELSDADELLEGIQTVAGDGKSVHLTGVKPIDQGLMKWEKNPSLMLYKLQTSIYKLSWLLIPLSLPFLWILFAGSRQYRLYDHTVFITYSIAFMSLLFVAVTVLNAIGLPDRLLTLAALIIPPLHIGAQLKHAYRLRWPAAILRTILLTLFSLVIFGLFLIILVLLGLS